MKKDSVMHGCHDAYSLHNTQSIWKHWKKIENFLGNTPNLLHTPCISWSRVNPAYGITRWWHEWMNEWLILVQKYAKHFQGALKEALAKRSKKTSNVEKCESKLVARCLNFIIFLFCHLPFLEGVLAFLPLGLGSFLMRATASYS